jgi:hypothetical protein
MIYLMKGETVEGSGGGSVSIINFYVSKIVSA